MPEGSDAAAILIAISYQALQRQVAMAATRKADNTIVILFAGFYIEATINAIIDQMNVRPKMNRFLNPANRQNFHPGLQDKLGWFYNEYVARKIATSRKQLYRDGITLKLRWKFPGFAKLYSFRNDVAHGKINRIADSAEETQALRAQAKVIRDSLYAIALHHDPDIKIDTTYWDAISS